MKSILLPELNAEFTTNWEGPLDNKNIYLNKLQNYGLFPWKISSDNKWWNRPIKKGEIGCAVSHWLCWLKAKESRMKYTLILEDDIQFIDGFWPIFQDGLKRLNEFDPSWDLIYLGRYRLEPDIPVIDGIVKPGYSHCTFAYLLTQSAIDKILQTSFDKQIIPVDEFLPALYIDHPREDVKLRYPKLLNAFAFYPPIVLQLSKEIAGSDTEDSDFIEIS